jgi:hypothetical protein
MAILLADCVNQVAALLNAAPNTAASYGNTVDDDKHPLGEIQASLQNANDLVMRAIYETEGHPHRTYQSPAVVASGSAIPDHIGPLGVIEISVGGVWKVGKTAPVTRIQQWIDNPLSLTTTAGYYAVLDDKILYYTGTSARVYYCTYTRATLTSNPTCPDEYFSTLVSLALAELFAKEGDDLQAAQHYISIGLAGLDSIRTGAFTVPPVEKYEQSR